MALAAVDLNIAEWVKSCYSDPLRFVRGAYPWSEPGPLQHHEGPDTWQTDFLTKLGEAVKERNFDGLTAVQPIRMATSSGHGIGKAQPVSLEIHTPDGLRRWGDLQVGDTVFGRDGRPTRIIAIHPQGIVPTFRVTFDDRSSTRVCGDHLWTVRGRQERRSRTDAWRTLSTSELATCVQRPNGRVAAKQWELPTIQPVEFAHADPLPIHPYVLGVWLGDGGRMSGLITSNDSEVTDRIAQTGAEIHQVDRFGWRVRGLRKKLQQLGILESYSYQKSVPVTFLERSSAERAELLRGLLDTDGECTRTGSVVFSSTSRALAEDVMWLARSLGGKSTIQPTVKHPTFTGPDGCRKSGLPCWRVTLAMPDGFRCFYITRKQSRIPLRREPRYLSRWIAAIEPDAPEECQCISVEAPDHLYLTNDFIPTHNSVMVAWIVDWIMSTRPHAQGTITANTYVQLETKTWPAIQRWTKLCLTGHWFEVTANRMYHPAFKESWFCSPQSCREENSEAFAGQHAADSTSFYINDEDSAVPDKIHEVEEGGLTDGEPMQFLFGNPTRSTGAFHAACFGSLRHRYITTIVDSRHSRFTNKAQIDEWVQDYGEDSDFVRVRVRGLPPRASDTQYIASDLVFEAQRRQPMVLGDEPLVCGLDVARGGSDRCVFRFRRGTDAQSLPPLIVPGQEARDSMRLVTMAAKVLDTSYGGRKVSTLFIDGTGIGGPICDRLKQLGHKNVMEIQFGSESPDPKFANMRAYMWGRMRDWLPKGAIDKSAVLETDLTGPGYHHDKRDRIVLESKESMKARDLASPDDGDALALTFAMPVKPKSTAYMPTYKPESPWG